MRLLYRKYSFELIFAILSIACGGCKKLVSVNAPVTSNTYASVFTSNSTAISAVTGVYAQMSLANTSIPGSIASLTLYTGLSADELSLYSGVINLGQIAYHKNALSAALPGYGTEYWTTLYSYIFSCNSAIAGLSSSTGLTPAVKQQLLGEALFLRSFFYFYLVNLYGEVPLVLTTDYKSNASLAKSSVSAVYQEIIADLKNAEQLLSANYLSSTLTSTTTERVRPTKWAAMALLSRAYLYSGDWPDAEHEADTIISNSSMYSLSPLTGPASVFIKNNPEAIWQLQPVSAGFNTQDAVVFIIPTTGPNTGSQTGTYLSSFLLNSFEAGDAREANWVGETTYQGVNYYYPYKYKVNTLNAAVSEYLMMLRLGEQYLIRAEARAEQNNISGATGALADLDIIRTRATLADYSGATDQASVLAAILHERQVEMFAELGQRWLDLKRTNMVSGVLGSPGNVCASKGGNWSSAQEFYPVPLNDLQNDPNLVQNAGY